ncbi:MAG: hypothetical protein GY816_17920 [Cytophagales bacterium]|nr:hypothetical protein [Cytophagales bacterium]
MNKAMKTIMKNKFSIMKNVLTFLMSVLIVGSLSAQKVKKPNVNKAKTLWSQGKLDEAKAMIDNATEFEKTMNDGKTWYYRGLIYATIDTISNPEYNMLSDNAREVAIASFDKANELAEQDKGYYILVPSGLPVTMDQQIEGYYAHYFTKALDTYEKKDWATTSENFEMAWSIKKSDTVAITNAGYTAQAAGNNERAYSLLEKSVESGARSLNIYYNMIIILNEKKDFEGTLEVISNAKEIYPSDNSLNRYEVDALIKLDKVDEAIEQLKLAIEQEPNDPILYFSIAMLYEDTDVDLAIEYYEGALKADPNHYESNYNLAVARFNQANVSYKEWTQLTTSAADKKKDKELKPIIEKGFAEALPYWEKVYELKAADQATLQTLMFLYSYLDNNDKADKMEEELNALLGE